MLNVDSEPFDGTIGRYFWESTPSWPEPVRPSPDAPNVLILLLDDVGFAQLGCFGSQIDTPVMDGLASNGLRYSNFHTTGLCSPTRSCVLTGRNHHSNGMGRITDLSTGFPGYSGRIPRSNGFLSQILVERGYATFAVGKWHLTPDEDMHLAAPRTSWPLGRGFERFYGFHGGETHQFAPWLVHDNHFVEQPRSIKEGYHLTEDLVDHAIEDVFDLRAVDAEKPFFLYLATGACHSPHHAPQTWLDHYRGRFDHGWDVEREQTVQRQRELGVIPAHTELSPRPDWVPAWDSLENTEQQLYSRFMEAFGAYLSHTDAQIGRLLEALEETGDLDNTVVLLLSDNGASSEGGPNGSVNDARPWNLVGRPLDEALERIDEIGGPRLHNNYPWGWTVAGNTPFRRWKREVHEGGVADPLIVSWPAGLASVGEVRTQYTHAIDLVPTLLELLDIDPPETLSGVTQTAMAGSSFAHTLADPDAPSNRHTQYFEMFGCQALYQDGWKAVSFHPIHTAEPGLDHVSWELYDLVNDPAECNDLSDQDPVRLAGMIEKWWEEAEKYQVLPLDNRPFSEFTLGRPLGPAAHRSLATYWPGTGMVPEEAVPPLFNRSHALRADVEIPESGCEGVLLSLGNLQGGFSFFVQQNRLVYVHNLVGKQWVRIEAETELLPGEQCLEARFTLTGLHQGQLQLFSDDRLLGTGQIDRFTPMRWNLTGAGLHCGADPGLPVCDDYESPFAFTATLHRVALEVFGDATLDQKAQAEVAVIRQ